MYDSKLYGAGLILETKKKKPQMKLLHEPTRVLSIKKKKKDRNILNVVNILQMYLEPERRRDSVQSEIRAVFCTTCT